MGHGDSAGYDSVLVLYFGGPEKPSDVMPFLRHVTRGRNVPEDRLTEVSEHYLSFGGRSPINDQARRMTAVLRTALRDRGVNVPVYWGNRNWHPFLADTLREMADAGHRRTVVYASSAFSSYPGCRQYLDDLAAARREVGGAAPILDKLPPFWDQPGFLDQVAAAADEAAGRLRRNAASGADAATTPTVVFTAHSIPLAMAAACSYENQLRTAAALVASRMTLPVEVSTAFQSRSGPPSQPWLEPDISDHLAQLAARSVRDVVVVPIGFLSDHMEVVYDLDQVAEKDAERLGLRMERAATVGTSARFVDAVADLLTAAIRGEPLPPGLSADPPSAYCHPDCCLPRRPSDNPQDDDPEQHKPRDDTLHDDRGRPRGRAVAPERASDEA